MDNTAENTADRPWYRQFWPWFVMALPAASVVAGLTTLYVAGGEPAMVVDDYGRIAMATQQRAERARHAAELGLSARLAFAPDSANRPGGQSQRVTVTLAQSAPHDDRNGGLVLRLVHPTREELDRTVELTGSRGHYAGRFERLPGRYYVALGDADGTWRLTGELHPGSERLELVSGARTSRE